MSVTSAKLQVLGKTRVGFVWITSSILEPDIFPRVVTLATRGWGLP